MNNRLINAALACMVAGALVGLVQNGMCSANRATSKPGKSAAKNIKKTSIMPRKKFKQAGWSNPISVEIAHVARSGHYSVTGDANGLVTVRDTTTGNVARTFQMTAGVPVRQVFLLNNAQTVGATQKDHTTFWDLASGNQTGSLAVEAYGFSHDEASFWGTARQELPCTLTRRCNRRHCLRLVRTGCIHGTFRPMTTMSR